MGVVPGKRRCRFHGGMSTGPRTKAEESPPHPSLAQRMRPMLMTALSAGIGLLPAALSTGIGSQVQRPLATVVVGGMLIGPIILLVVVPALQTLFVEGADGDRPAAPVRSCAGEVPA